MKFLKNFTRALFDITVAPQRLVDMAQGHPERAAQAAERVAESKDAMKEAAKEGLKAAGEYVDAQVNGALAWAEGFRQRTFVEPWATGTKEARRIGGAAAESTATGYREIGRGIGRGAEVVGDAAGTVAEGTATGYREIGRGIGRGAEAVEDFGEQTLAGQREMGRVVAHGAEAVGDAAGTVAEGTATGYREIGRGIGRGAEAVGDAAGTVAEGTATGYREIGRAATRGAETVSDVVAVTRDIAAEEAAPLMERFEQGLAERRGQVTQELFEAAVEAEVAAPQEKTVKVDSLNIRTAPSIHADRTGVLKKGEKVTLALDPPPTTEEDGFKWAQCPQGWVAIGKSDGSADYLG